MLWWVSEDERNKIRNDYVKKKHMRCVDNRQNGRESPEMIMVCNEDREVVKAVISKYYNIEMCAKMMWEIVSSGGLGYA